MDARTGQLRRLAADDLRAAQLLSEAAAHHAPGGPARGHLMTEAGMLATRAVAALLTEVTERLERLEGLLTPPEPTEPAPALPHSRACGIQPHAHGPACASDCPTCHPAAPDELAPRRSRRRSATAPKTDEEPAA